MYLVNKQLIIDKLVIGGIVEISCKDLRNCKDLIATAYNLLRVIDSVNPLILIKLEFYPLFYPFLQLFLLLF